MWWRCKADCLSAVRLSCRLVACRSDLSTLIELATQLQFWREIAFSTPCSVHGFERVRGIAHEIYLFRRLSFQNMCRFSATHNFSPREGNGALSRKMWKAGGVHSRAFCLSPYSPTTARSHGWLSIHTDRHLLEKIRTVKRKAA